MASPADQLPAVPLPGGSATPGGMLPVYLPSNERSANVVKALLAFSERQLEPAESVVFQFTFAPLSNSNSTAAAPPA